MDLSQGYDFSCGHVWMWELNCEVGWVLKNWCFWTVLLEKTFESPLDCKEIKPVNPKENQSWIFIRRTDAEAETPVLWPPDSKSWLIWKDPDARKDWGQEEKGTTEDETVGWHHWRDGHEFGWTPGVGDGQGGLLCCSPWGRKESDKTERLNWTELNITSDGDCSHEIKRCLLLGRKVMTNLDSIFKSRDITLPTSPFTQTHVHRVSDIIQPSHPLSSPSPPTFNLSQHQGLF